ncbi:MAG: isoleucine--tRNA ligase [Gemmatimonadetes bacterium]|nr:isoleucine--tRNA ligase [Gemmatimonadota bacterium]
MTYERLPVGSANELEQEVLEQWRAEDLFHQTLDATKDAPPFVFYEGPPTANGRPGIHHVFARTIKDLICRYQALKGKSVTRIAGWDTHGLPVEIEVEKALNINGKTEIEAFGVAKFNRRSRESVFVYKNDWESLSDRIGYWLDYDNPYITYTNDYIESVWWLLKQLWTKDLLYEGHKVLPYCGRCGTSLSSHELAMGYATHKSPSIYALFRLRENGAAASSPRHLLVWTTTPWTLPSNVAIAVNPDFQYVELDVEGTRLIVEKTIADSHSVPGATHGEPLGSFPTIAEYKGRELVGLRYEQLLDVVEVDADKAFRVVAGDFVTRDEGTGIVHMAPAFGADDYDTIQREGMAFVNPVDDQSRFSETKWDAINGVTVFEANDPIAARLEAEGKLFGRYEPKGYEHTYPFCWRCDSPLIYYARRSWFVRTTAFKDEMVAHNNEVHWHPPEVGSGRFGEWLENNVDWALSRDRFWGTPLPAWKCDSCDECVVIGAYAELAERWGRTLPPDFDPHKPGVDDVVFSCSSCEGTMRRVPQVIDAWFDSGAMPYAQWHYPFENEKEFETHFPADFICEGLDQTRGWFYSLLAIAAGVSGTGAYRNVIVNGLVLDADGSKMSKRVGNVVNPWEAVEQFGADAVRLYLLASSQVWLSKRFDPRTIPEVAGGFLNRLRNTYDFFARYADPALIEQAPPPDDRPVIDRWLLSRVAGVVHDVNTAWSNFDVTSGTRALMDFCVNDLSQWYVRLNRSRFWAPDADADPAAVATLYEALVTVVRLVAPAAPFVSDAIHRRLTGRSVHLATFPEERAGRQPELDDAMATVRRLASMTRNVRDGAALRTRQPLAELRVAVPAAMTGSAFDACLALLAREVNVKSVTVVASDAELVTLKGKPNFRSLGKVYGKQTPLAAAAVQQLAPEQLVELENGTTVTLAVDGTTFEYRPEDVVVARHVTSDWLVQADGALVVALDPEISTELRQEGLARELVNRVQRLRKDAGYDYTTRVALAITGTDDVLEAARAFDTFIAGETLAKRFEIGDELSDPDVREAVDLDGRSVVVMLARFESEEAAY